MKNAGAGAGAVYGASSRRRAKIISSKVVCTCNYNLSVYVTTQTLTSRRHTAAYPERDRGRGPLGIFRNYTATNDGWRERVIQPRSRKGCKKQGTDTKYKYHKTRGLVVYEFGTQFKLCIRTRARPRARLSAPRRDFIRGFPFTPPAPPRKTMDRPKSYSDTSCARF
ncbi:hypothetical protein EVAR_54022_1 [Eumeta japonica]|uniref:Uncharacterized protein n=1 Tax=Eumeta variegata TaxID=151549 RepID=A0A4C1XSQ8_EUMVA|nr:hypothetical protein EVAR_54022_1 [Eumeta japonica]